MGNGRSVVDPSLLSFVSSKLKNKSKGKGSSRDSPAEIFDALKSTLEVQEFIERKNTLQKNQFKQQLKNVNSVVFDQAIEFI